MSSSDGELVGSDIDIDAVVIDHDDVSNYNPEQILPQPPETIAKLRTWLNPTSYAIAGGEYRKHLDSHVAGTGAWLTASTAYQEWLQSEEHGLLWIKGIPGSGKSVMAASLIRVLAESHPGVPVLYFFFRQIIEANHEPQALLRDWMDQMLIYSPPLQKELKTLMDNNRSVNSLSREDMWKFLRQAFAGLPGKVFCVADALDEMDRGNDTFLQALGALGHWYPKKAKVLITSRPVAGVEGPLRKTPCLHIRLEETLVDMDISTYVRHALSRSQIQPEDWDTVTNAVPGRANGLFLYAKLAMDAFLEPGADVKTVLSQLPADLNVLYTELLAEHARRSGVAEDLQHLILQAVTHAARPLRLLELADMIKTNCPGDATRDLKMTKDLIRAACGPLLEILADETVSVIHHSFTEYLKGTTRLDDGSGYPILKPGLTHARLAAACLQYLRAGCLDSVKIKIEDEGDDRDYDDWDGSYTMASEEAAEKEQAQLRLKHPSFEYAASNWYHHIRKSEAAGFDQAETNAVVREFLANQQQRQAWLQIKWSGGSRGARRVNSLHITAKIGILSFTKELLGVENVEVDALDSRGNTPLSLAASGGHSAVVAELIAAGADPDMPDTVGGLKPLHAAASFNHQETARVLLEAGVDPLTEKMNENPGRFCGNAPTTRGQTPLMYACHNGHLETLEAFLPFLKDTETAQRALMWAAERGRSKLVARILQHPGVDVNAKVRGDTPLLLACSAADVATIQILLQAGADANIRCSGSGDEFAGIGECYSYMPGQDYSTRASCFLQVCGMNPGRSRPDKDDPETQQTIFSLLVQAGVDVHERNAGGGTALHGTTNSPVLTRLLLDAGVDANAADKAGNTPLHLTPSEECIALLVEQGRANINLVDDRGNTPLHNLLGSYDKKRILKFLGYEPDCNIVNKSGDGPLHTCLSQGTADIEVIEALLKAGADPNLRNHAGDTPLFCRREDGNQAEKLLDMLLKAGADINTVDQAGQTLLFASLSKSRPAYGREPHSNIQDLLDRGASISARDFQGRTLLHESVKASRLSTPVARTFGDSDKPAVPQFDFLIGLGLDIKAVDQNGNTLLHELALDTLNHDSAPERMSTPWERLAAMGLDLEQKNHAGQTPLHILCASSSKLRDTQRGQARPIEFVIQNTKDLNNPDNDGITPLHMAATGLEDYVKKLLEAGANPLAVTYEGLTPLHIAVRCRESNIVGLLLDALRERSGVSLGTQGMSPSGQTDAASSNKAGSAMKPVVGVNAKAFGEAAHITPLFYACQSGRPETVALLLAAGADAKDGGILRACIGFEEEDAAWPQITRNWTPARSRNEGFAVAVKLADKSRPTRHAEQINYDSLGDNKSTRLEEILDMLVAHGADVSQLGGAGLSNDPVAEAEASGRSYTAACLRKFKQKHKVSNAPGLFGTTDDTQERNSCPTLKLSEPVAPGNPTNNHTFRSYLVNREYEFIEELARLGATFLPAVDQKSDSHNLGVLIKEGFASLVENIGSIVAESSLREGNWHAFGDETKAGLWCANKELRQERERGSNHVPFLIEAVRRRLPNMDMVKLLVEKFSVDVNELHYTQQYIDRGYEIVPERSALHSVAMASCWWHARQALPYLLKAGADPNIRDYKGQTVLHVALRGSSNCPGPYGEEVVRTLLAAGADANAVDKAGQSSLAFAQHSVSMIRLLISHGATVTADALLAAIDAKNTDVLRALLSRGADANMRVPRPTEDPNVDKKRGRKVARPPHMRLDPHEEFPIYRAGMAYPSTWNVLSQAPPDAASVDRIIQVMLDHGANPFAKYLEDDTTTGNDFTKRAFVSAAGKSLIDVPPGYRERTVLHELFFAARLSECFLRIPGLDVDHRDAQGRTVLLAACLGHACLDKALFSETGSADGAEGLSLFQRLLSLGADVEARDNFGRNCLHSMIGDFGSRMQFSSFENSLQYVLEKVPHLLQQVDGTGSTPLHYAVARGAKNGDTKIAELFLATGADPHAIDNNGDSVLHLLAKGLSTESQRHCFKDLVARGVDINARNSKGETPLFNFCTRAKRDDRFFRFSLWDDDEEPEVFSERRDWQLMEELGADFFAQDVSGRGLLHVAASGDERVYKALIGRGLDPMLEDNMQQTSIDVAAACVNKEVLAFFEKKI